MEGKDNGSVGDDRYRLKFGNCIEGVRFVHKFGQVLVNRIPYLRQGLWVLLL
jgi:hypothetical protein